MIPNSGGNTDFVRPELLARGVFILKGENEMKELPKVYDPKSVEKKIYGYVYG